MYCTMQLDPTVQNCVDCYTSDWVVVNRKYQQYSTSLRQVQCTVFCTG